MCTAPPYRTIVASGVVTAASAKYAYGPAVAKAAGANYVELDLYQPELVKGIMLEPEWAGLLALSSPDKVILYQRGARSWVMLLPKG